MRGASGAVEFPQLLLEAVKEGRRHPQPPHPRIDLQMKTDGLGKPSGAFSVNVETCGRGNRWSQIIFNKSCRVAHVKSTEQQDGLAQARLAQLEGFFNRRYSKPVRATLFEQPGYGFQAVTVGIGFNHCHHFTSASKLSNAREVAA